MEIKTGEIWEKTKIRGYCIKYVCNVPVTEWWTREEDKYKRAIFERRRYKEEKGSGPLPASAAHEAAAEVACNKWLNELNGQGK